jgi:hypothetical protein
MVAGSIRDAVGDVAGGYVCTAADLSARVSWRGMATTEHG